MPTILFPTRGGKDSYPNQDWAISTAIDQKADLIFLFVSNVRFLIGLSSPVVVDVQTELNAMGEFLLAMAQERAEKAGWQAGAIVRHGMFEDALREVIQTEDVSTLILGSSPEGSGITTLEYLSQLAQALMDDFGIEVHILQNGQPLSHFMPPSLEP